jgi:hypothetical protein
VADDQTLRELERGVEELQHRRVKIVLAGHAAQTLHDQASVPGIGQKELTSPQQMDTQGGALAVIGQSPRGVKPEGQPGSTRSARRDKKVGRATRVDVGGIVVTAGTLVPGVVVSGPPRDVLIATGASVLGAVVVRVMDRLSRKSEAL